MTPDRYCPTSTTVTLVVALVGFIAGDPLWDMPRTHVEALKKVAGSPIRRGVPR